MHVYCQLQQVLPVPSTHAAYFGHTDHPQALNIMYFMPEDEHVFSELIKSVVINCYIFIDFNISQRDKFYKNKE